MNQTKNQFQIKYFENKVRELQHTMMGARMSEEDQVRGHILICHEMLEDLEDEFRHVMVYREETNWPVCDQWNKYQDRINPTSNESKRK